MSDVIEKYCSKVKTLCAATEETLNEWEGEGNLQFPDLLKMMAVKYNWDEKQVRQADPTVRDFVRDHPNWYVTRGAHGGIMKSTTKQKKDEEKMSKELAKQQMREAIAAKTAAQKAETEES